MSTTTIEVQTETWRQLNLRKDPGESFDDVISDLMTATIREAEPEQEPKLVFWEDCEADEECSHYTPDRGPCNEAADYVLGLTNPSGEVQELPYCEAHANLSDEEAEE